MKHAKHSKKSDFYLQTGFAFGNLYKTTKEELNTIGAASGGAVSSIQLARWMAELLLRETGGEELGDSKRVSKMRRGPTARGVVVAAQAVDVRPYGRRTLSKAARKAISDAQKRRWRKQKQQRKQRKPFIMTPARLRSARKNAALARQARILKLQKAA